MVAFSGEKLSGSAAWLLLCPLNQAIKAFDVVRQAHEVPFPADLLHATQEEPPKAHDFFDNAEHGLDRLFS